MDEATLELLREEALVTSESWPYAFRPSVTLARDSDATLRRAGIEKKNVLGQKLTLHSFRHLRHQGRPGRRTKPVPPPADPRTPTDRHDCAVLPPRGAPDHRGFGVPHETQHGRVSNGGPKPKKGG